MEQDKRFYIAIICIGIIPVIWLALLIAPLVDGGLIKIISELSNSMNNPFKITICENSINTVLFFLLIYFISISAFFFTRKNYRKGQEHGSAQWGNIREINMKYKQLPDSENRILTQNIRLGLNARKHRRNLNTLVVGRKWCR